MTQANTKKHHEASRKDGQGGFLLVAKPAPGSSRSEVPAMTVARSRLQSGLWPIYEHTRNRLALHPGVRVAIYLSRIAHIVATAQAGELFSASLPWRKPNSAGAPIQRIVGTAP